MDPRISATIQMFHSSYSQHLDLNDIAKAVNLSVSGFRHLFKAEIGMTPTRYLGLVRMDAATDLVEHSFQSMKQVGASVGMNTRSTFDRAYKLSSGGTPSAARASSEKRVSRGEKQAR